MSYQIIQDDILNWAGSYNGPKFHAIFCDPPYHLTSIHKRFSKPGSKPAQFGKNGAFSRASRGFMQNTWDGGDIAFNPETWQVISQHLYPGGFIMAFAGTRGYHRMASAMEGNLSISPRLLNSWAEALAIAERLQDWDMVKQVEQSIRDVGQLERAMEDAGLIIHPAMIWVNLSGFPKATNISLQCEQKLCYCVKTEDKKEWFYRDDDEPIRTSPPFRSEQANLWWSHRYGLQALKPCLEFLAVAQKPYKGKPVDNIVGTGAGAWNIDGGRIPLNGEDKPTGSGNPATTFDRNAINPGRSGGNNGNETSDLGRWPANLILSEEGAETLDRQSGDRPAGGSKRQSSEPITKNVYGEKYTTDFDSYGDSGGASRMFFKSHWAYEVFEQLQSADPLKYEPKVSTAEREAGLNSLSTQTRHRMRPDADPEKLTGLNSDPKFAPTKMKNHHPTLKPISLTKYLATLLLPPDAYAPRRILVPFAGTGSEMIGAILAGWDEVIGIEANPDYHTIGEVRLKWWSQWPGWGQTEVDKILSSLESKSDENEQLNFFDV